MKPAEAAKLLADLNWSGVPTAHQVAVSAALETLKSIPVTAVEALETYAAATKLAKNSAYGRTRGNVVALPVTRWTRLYNLDGSLWLSSCHFGPEGAWGWVLESVAHEHGVDEDQIASLEGDDSQYDGDDLVTVDGLPAYRLRHTSK